MVQKDLKMIIHQLSSVIGGAIKSTGSPDGQVIASRSLVPFEERKCGSISAAWYHNTPQYLPTYYELLTPFLTLHLSLLNPFPPPCTFRFQRKN